MVPEVKVCTVNQCFYNRENECHAHAITVGSDEPICETFLQSGTHVTKHAQGEVGACHVDNCEYNKQMFCSACSDIQVSMSGGKAICDTFEPK